VLSSSGFKLGSAYWLLVLFVMRNPRLYNKKPSITIAAMAVPTPIPALAPVEIPAWEGLGDDIAGVDALVGADDRDALEGTDVCARDVGVYIGVT